MIWKLAFYKNIILHVIFKVIARLAEELMSVIHRWMGFSIQSKFDPIQYQKIESNDLHNFDPLID